MKKMFILLLFCTTLAGAKNNEIDSLQSLLKTNLPDTSKAKALSTLGMLYITSGEYPKAIQNLLSAMRLYEKSKDDYGILICRSRLADVYSYGGDTKTALNYILDAKPGVEDGIIYDQFGYIYYQKGLYKQSLTYWYLALGFYGEKKDEKVVARILNDMGSVYELLGKKDSAFSFYKKSLQLGIKTRDNISTLNSLASLGDFYFSEKKYEKSLQYEYKSLEVSRKIKDKSMASQTEKVISDIYTALNNPSQSLIHYKNYVALKDSLLNEENIKQIVRAEENFKFEKEREIAKIKQDKEDSIKREEIRHNRRQRNVFIGGFSIVLIISVVLFFTYRKSKKKGIIIEAQKKEVENKRKELTDNMNYAYRIQKAILPSEEYLKNNFPSYFTIYKPKDIVSGDFYWAYADENYYYFATADCTGHGVSGAMMSMVGTQLLNEIVIERGIKNPAEVLNTLRLEIIKSLNPEGAVEERKDGMDAVFCRIAKDSLVLTCALANNPIYIVREGEITEIKPDRFPIGKYDDLKPFKLNYFELQKGDTIYTFSDGFCDQFGGEKGKKLMAKRFKEWVVEISSLEMSAAKNELENRFNTWLGNGEQTDDVTVFALKA